MAKFLQSSLDLNDIKWKDGNVLINHQGGIICTAHVMARTWCSPSEDLVHWPYDTHVCALRMGLWSQHAQLNISTDKEFSSNDSIPMVRFIINRSIRLTYKFWLK